MKICNFTQSELDQFRTECNFTEMESRCFELKAKDCTDVQLALRLNISESTAAVMMRRVRSKITTVLEKNHKHLDEQFGCGCGKSCIGIICHTMDEWARIPDFLSKKGTIYVYSDYRTDNDVSIPRLKIGDGISSISEIPFATMSITDSDMEYWDNKPDPESNDLGKIVTIDESYTADNRYIFPSDGYLRLDFDGEEVEFAEANIYGAGGKSYFVFSKHTERDNQSKEVYVRKGMQCEFVRTSENARIKFIPLV